MTDPRNEPEDVDTEEYETDEGLDLDRLHAETRHRPYRFKWGGRWWELPHPQDLPDGIFDAYEQLSKLAEGEDDQELSADDIAAVRQVLVLAFGKRQWTSIAEIEPIPLSTQFRLFNRWMKWAGAEPGESSSSAGSSNGTAGRSKLTSRGSTASASARRSTGARKTAVRRVNSSA